MEEAAARLRTGESDVGRIADLTGVPAALVELMKDAAAAEAGPSSARGDGSGTCSAPRGGRRAIRGLLMTAIVLSACAVGCTLTAVVTGSLVIGRLGALAAVMALLCCGHAGRMPRRR